MKFLLQLISRLLAPLGHALLSLGTALNAVTVLSAFEPRPRPVLVPIPIQTRHPTGRLTRRPGGQGD
jgi:hypothetical protein